MKILHARRYRRITCVYVEFLDWQMDTIFFQHPSPWTTFSYVLPFCPRRSLKSNIARSTGHLWRTSRNFVEIWFQRKIREIQILFAYPLPCTFCWAHSQWDIFFVEWHPVKMSLHWTKFDPTFLRLELCSVKFLPSQSQELSNAKQNAARGKVVKAVKFKGHDRPQAVQISIWLIFSRIFLKGN